MIQPHSRCDWNNPQGRQDLTTQSFRFARTALFACSTSVPQTMKFVHQDQFY
ncbi:hypothetical protein RBSH_03230 [Rhodopirellula baltica SH28]|nr:hypothetical protein RBWH47_05259 [Rhodopirellula baltica WH47]EKK01483.1 hypothetical protein RBSH_03230 [Rhodopirellula baltica SH28]ELP29788.1 hypothetical protein RBSWK_06316 [Rhodopirellula baltica SWK14]